MSVDCRLLLEKHLQELCQGIGTRLVGTLQNHNAAQYIQETFETLGYQVDLQAFDCPSWECKSYDLYVGDTKLSGLVNTFSPSCQVEAPFKVIDQFEALESTDFQNHICVLSGELSKEVILPLSSPVYLPDDHRKLSELLIRKAPLALICLSHTPNYTVPLFEDTALNIPSVTLSAEESLKLLKHSDETIRLRIESQLGQGQSSNVIAKMQSGKPYRILLCAHYDTKPYTVGAFDNASGIAVLLSVAEALRSTKLDIGLELIAFSGEEYGMGGDTYLASHGLTVIPYGEPYSHQVSSLDQVIACINIDGVGAHLGVDALAMMSMSEEATRFITMQAQAFHLPVTSPWPASNHYDFYTHNVPSIAFNSMHVPNLIHHERDDLRWLDLAKLERLVDFLTHLVKGLQTKEPEWSWN